MNNQRLRELLIACEANQLSSGELEELHELLEQHWNTIPLNLEAPHVNWGKMYQSIISAEEVRKLPVRRIRPAVWAAAAAVLVFSVCCWILLGTGKTSKRQELSNASNVAPGASKATLTLGNGRTIQLDSVAQTITDVNGVEIINFNKGQLVYNDERNVDESSVSYNTLSTPKGGQYQAILPDGSKVWLNAASSIRFPSRFTGKERRVAVTGEVYIEVLKDAAQPFFVLARNTEVQVLGTSFNINSYDDEPTIQTTLVEGSVKVLPVPSVNYPLSSVVLSPGQQSIQSDQHLNTQSANIEQVLAWKNGYFNFNGLTLQEMLRAIARWYDVEVVYNGTITPERFGGAIQRDLSLREILDVLKQTGVHFKIEDRKLIVVP